MKSNALRIIVEDDGVGFDPEAAEASSTQRLGLSGIRERLALLGGELTIETAPGRGATIFVVIPLSQEEAP